MDSKLSDSMVGSDSAVKSMSWWRAWTRAEAELDVFCGGAGELDEGAAGAVEDWLWKDTAEGTADEAAGGAVLVAGESEKSFAHELLRREEMPE